MINKFVRSLEEAMSGIKDGSVVLLGGFGRIGVPFDLVDALEAHGARDLTIVHNNASSFPELLRKGRVRKVISSHPRSNQGVNAFAEAYLAGKVELEIVPQGTLAERIRAAGAGVGAFYTPTGVGTEIAKGKEVREVNGKMQMLEYALPGDVALIEAWQADRWGNLTYNGAGNNFNHVMATAAKNTIVQTQHTVELGDFHPEAVKTPGLYVNRVVHVPYGKPGIRVVK